jgi:hypothetical protein
MADRLTAKSRNADFRRSAQMKIGPDGGHQPLATAAKNSAGVTISTPA